MSIFKELNSSMNLDEMRRIIKENSMNAIKLKNKIKAIDAIPKTKSDFVVDYSITADVEVIDDEDEIDEEEEFKYYYDNMMDGIIIPKTRVDEQPIKLESIIKPSLYSREEIKILEKNATK